MSPSPGSAPGGPAAVGPVRAIHHVSLTDIVRAVHAASRSSYGARPVHAELTIGRWLPVGRWAVMHLEDLQGLPRRHRRRPVHKTPTASGLVDRNFARS
jgi:hypothetical protein